MLRRLCDEATRLGARAVWLETQNVNLPAIRFYRAFGFQLAGLDDSLYDPKELPGECAVFLALSIGD